MHIIKYRAYPKSSENLCSVSKVPAICKSVTVPLPSTVYNLLCSLS